MHERGCSSQKQAGRELQPLILVIYRPMRHSHSSHYEHLFRIVLTIDGGGGEVQDLVLLGRRLCTHIPKLV